MAHIMDARMMINIRAAPGIGSDSENAKSDERSGVSRKHSRARQRSRRLQDEPETEYGSPDQATEQTSRSNLLLRALSLRGAPLTRQATYNEPSLTVPDLIDLQTMSAEVFEWEGYLYKKRKVVKSWRPRYVTVQHKTVTFYKSKSHAIAKEPIRDAYEIKEVISSLSSSGISSTKLQPQLHGFSFIAKDDTLVNLIATSPLDKAMWIHALKQSIAYSGHRRRRSDKKSHRLLNETQVTSEALPDHAETLSNGDRYQDCNFSSLANRFLVKILYVLTNRELDAVTDRLCSLLRQISKDAEILFDLESLESNRATCTFKGVYHGREGFVHFISLYRSKYVLATDAKMKPSRKSQHNGEFQSYVFIHQKLCNSASGTKTDGNLILQLTFTPAQRIGRVVLSFRKNESNQVRKSLKTVNPSLLSEYPPCFHQAYLCKRSLALSFSDFDVVGVLGQGGFGTVVLVRLHHDPEELFAIKIIDKHSGAKTALKERRILSGVRHPFLVCLRFAFQTQTKLYLGMDYYKGGNLYLHMHASQTGDPNMNAGAGTRFSIERAKFYAAELAVALSYLHSCGILYRDLKPDNVMLDKSGHIRLVDFGISKQLQYENNEYAPTGTLAGSPAYIAPEQLLTQKPQYGMQADWWSYGVLLYEMLTGITPFADPNIAAMYRKIQTAQVNYERQPPIDDSAIDLLQKLLVRDPNQRIDINGIKSHAFFDSIDWERLEKKEVEAPFIPHAKQLMENVHAHYRNMHLDDGSLGEKMEHHGIANGHFFRKKPIEPDSDHFESFSFSYDVERDSVLSVNMADDGWLMQQLRHGAAMRGRLQDDHDDAEIASSVSNASSLSNSSEDDFEERQEADDVTKCSL